MLPLALSTAAAGLYESHLLNLSYPSLTPQLTGQVIIVWGASSSVGSTAVQLAAASGLKIVATASSKNAAFVKGLGAAAVIDYHSSSLVEQVVQAVKATGAKFAGVYDAVGTGGWQDIVSQLGGGKVASVLPPPKNLPPGVSAYGCKFYAIYATLSLSHL